MSTMVEPQIELGTNQAVAGRVLLGTFTNYRDAQALVDKLSDAHFPVEKTSIVIRDLAFVEQVTGRLTWVRALGNGIVSGLMIGLLSARFSAYFSLLPLIGRPCCCGPEV